MSIQIQEAQQIPMKINLSKTSSRDIMIKVPKVKKKNRFLKAERKRLLIMYKGRPKDYQQISQDKL
jgi:hypothetical protein